MESTNCQGAVGEETHSPQAEGSISLPQQKAKGYCRFYSTKNGCRAGDACPFVHDPSKLQSNEPRHNARPKAGRKPGPEIAASQPSQGSGPSNGQSPVTGFAEYRRNAPPAVDGNRVVSKPVSKAQSEDPRSFQITQLKRRFSPTEVFEDGGTAFAFQMVPSDPEFPFEMVGLECLLHVPITYPKGGKPRLEVKNEDMGREWQARVEKGFASLVAGMPGGTLLGLMRELDKQLEGLLTDKEPENFTIIPNYIPGRSREQQDLHKSTDAGKAILSDRTLHSKPPQTFSPEQRRQAAERRESETRQLEARLGRTPLFFKSSDGIAYTLPITPRRHQDLPVPLQVVKSVKLFVPLLYPLQQCRVELQGVSKDAAKATEKAFEHKAKDSQEGTLMGHVNFLAQNMHVLATDVQEEPKVEEDEGVHNLPPVQVGESAVEAKIDPLAEDDRNHIKFIPRPPEWASGNCGEESSDDEDSDSYDSGDEFTDEEANGVPLPTVPETSTVTTAPERGIALSFPSLELYGIELLELVSLCITIKCERCKDTMDINNLHDKAQKAESCKKCAMPLSVGFRRELMHGNSFRAGYLDLERCTVVDMLPSNLLPTCSSCSTTSPLPGIVSVRGSSTFTTCRECHQKLTFKIPEIKFLLISSASRASLAPIRKKPKESLGIVAGQELPRRGRCTHYSKSYRWFRFSCCEKVFACDRCHDEGSDHANEHANRMICGFCSREQNYRPEDCGVCHSSLVKKAGSGFWEGGRGTRDKTKMSRKDPRKYKRRPGGAVRKK